MVEFWPAILIASGLVYSWKILGYLVPKRFAESPRVVDFANQLTVALLASLLLVQTLTNGSAIALDARIPAVAVAGVLYWRKVPFLISVLSAALVATVLRQWLGWN